MISESVLNCMNKDFAVITPDMPVVEATQLLIKKEALGGPVVDSNGILQGWISEQECLHVCIQVLYHNERVSTVDKIMQPQVLSVPEDCDLLQLASQMLANKPKNYPVVDSKNKVLGIITRRRLLSLLGSQISKK